MCVCVLRAEGRSTLRIHPFTRGGSPPPDRRPPVRRTLFTSCRQGERLGRMMMGTLTLVKCTRPDRDWPGDGRYPLRYTPLTRVCSESRALSSRRWEAAARVRVLFLECKKEKLMNGPPVIHRWVTVDVLTSHFQNELYVFPWKLIISTNIATGSSLDLQDAICCNSIKNRSRRRRRRRRRKTPPLSLLNRADRCLCGNFGQNTIPEEI